MTYLGRSVTYQCSRAQCALPLCPKMQFQEALTGRTSRYLWIGTTWRKSHQACQIVHQEDNAHLDSEFSTNSSESYNSVSKLFLVSEPSFWQMHIQWKAEDYSIKAKIRAIMTRVCTYDNLGRSARRAYKKVVWRIWWITTLCILASFLRQTSSSSMNF